MGLLDDAIREHLELKRRHGADAAEIARLEQEALGPARRTSAEDAPASAGAVSSPVAEAAPPPPPTPEPELGEAHAPVVEDDYVFEGHEEFEEAEPLREEPESLADAPLPVEPVAEEPVTEVAPRVPPAPPEPPPAEEPQATVEFEPGSEEEWADDWDSPERSEPPAAVEEAPGEPEEAEDVLEETPDFLQETPEHDRLWFEQKPPRDFDF